MVGRRHDKKKYPANLVSCLRNRPVTRMGNIALETSGTAANKGKYEIQELREWMVMYGVQ